MADRLTTPPAGSPYVSTPGMPTPRDSTAIEMMAERGPSWMSARARNAARRGLLIATVGAGAFLVALIGLVLVPRQVSRAARQMTPDATERVDTAPIAGALARARANHATALAQLAERRATAVRRTAAATAAPAAFPAVLVPRRDSLAAAITTISRLLARAEAAPLPSSYRALGEAAVLRADGRVRALLDSLVDIQREREAFGGVGGVDPIFVALTARATTVGRTIQTIADERRTALRRELATLRAEAAAMMGGRPLVAAPVSTPALAAPAAGVASVAAADSGADSARAASEARMQATAAGIPDTMPFVVRAGVTAQGLADAEAALRTGRARAADYERRVREARELGNVAAPPVALLCAALVLGVGIGFLASVIAEFRHPRIADAAEAERVSGARVLAVVHAQPALSERTRRRSDQETSPLLDSTTDAYRLLYLHLSATGRELPLVTVTGDDAAITATVATNLAAAAAYESRATLLVDGDLDAGRVAGVLRVRPEPGIATVLAGRAQWSDVVLAATIGRDRSLDVIPSGFARVGTATPGVVDLARRELLRLAGRYDLAVLVTDELHAERGATSLMPAPDVLVVARSGHTSLRWLAHAVDALRGAGTRVRGIVIWDAEAPVVPTREELLASTVGRGSRRSVAAAGGGGPSRAA